MNVIIGAMEVELMPLIEALKATEIIKYDHIKLYQSGIWLIAITQIGKVNAAIGLTTLINDYAIFAVYNLGTAGSVQQHLLPLTTCVVESGIYTDANAMNFGYSFGQIPREPAQFCGAPELLSKVKTLLPTATSVVLGTGDTFVDSLAHYEPIRQLSADSIGIVDMEGTAYLQTAHKFGIPCVNIKIISDSLHNPTKSTEEFHTNLTAASQQIMMIGQALIFKKQQV